ncbi:DUF1343 domain-containing protein [Daejeonella sp.]|uniref:exo-beta-N-acetylmuramidase NamZ family protein n=1 Tax=Daejeonella sp. TaxID=2805397 RepID=UPI0030BE74AD
MKENFRPFLICVMTVLFILSLEGLGWGHHKAEYSMRGNVQNMMRTGADETEQYISYLKGKRIAVVASPASLIGKTPLVDSLLTLKINIVKIFGSEHGFRGNASNGAKVEDEIDATTGIPIISLYGKKIKPTKEDLVGIDLVTYDIQDGGARFFTKLRTLREVMEACAENNIELLILDRPNPNASYIDGPILDTDLKSAVGMFPIPITHGMTLAEMAQMINGEGWLANNAKCKLRIVKNTNYTHNTPYTLPVGPTPNLNSQQAVMLYPSLCLFEGTVISQGRGTMLPFTMVGAPALEGKYAFSFAPVSIPGMSEDPPHKDKTCFGLDFRTYDTSSFAKTGQINIAWLMELYNAYPQKEEFFRPFFDRLAGTKKLKEQIIAGLSEADIRKSWEPGLSAYKQMRKKYLIYP